MVGVNSDPTIILFFELFIQQRQSHFYFFKRVLKEFFECAHNYCGLTFNSPIRPHKKKRTAGEVVPTALQKGEVTVVAVNSDLSYIQDNFKVYKHIFDIYY